MQSPVKGYKVTNKDLKCQNYQFEIGKQHTQSGVIVLCSNGFHFCKKLSHCFNYYSFNKENRVFEVEASGHIDHGTDKSCAESITLIRELSWQEVLESANEGIYNTGYGNTGDRNTGDWNTGDRNTGDWNTGDRNTGYSNTGDRNTGLFCTETPAFPIFDSPSNWTEKEFLESRVYQLMRNYVDTKIWVPEHAMSEEEKTTHKGWKAAEGYVKDIPFKEAFQNAWHNWSEANKQHFLDLPNFNAEKFEFITGVKIKKD